MITSPINPMRYWKLEEIQRMLNKIEGYENVVVEFQCKQADGWNKLNWDCKYGIKEQLVNGQWNWLLKHKFVIEATTELDAHNLAWQEATERLVTDVWRTSINSFRKQQQELSKNNQFQIALEKMNRTPMNVVDEAPKPSITKIEDTMTEKTNTNTQTNKIQWTETKLWTISSIFFITFLLLGWFYPMIVLSICGIALGALALYVIIWLGTILLKDVLGLDDE
jgi:cation transport ATPase